MTIPERNSEGEGFSEHPESENHVLRETRRRLSKISEILSGKDSRCTVNLLGVVHDWEPGGEILDRISKADIVTLELTRNVVKSGLSAGPSKILQKNIFWREIVASLRENQQGIIRGIEVNQTPRVAWKRFSLHHGEATLGAAFLTVEADREFVEDLVCCLSEEDLGSLKKFNWLMLDSIPVTALFLDLVHEAVKSPDFKGRLPLSLCDGFSLVSLNDKEHDAERFVTTLMLPPHHSLEEARLAIEGELKQSSVFLSDLELSSLARAVMEDYLLAQAELNDAEEIVYALSQFVRRGLKPQQGISVLHIGGAGHSSIISQIISECLPPGCKNIEVVLSHDPRFGPYKGWISQFFKENIPLTDLLSVAKVKGFEVSVDPQKAAREVVLAINRNKEDFQKRILVERIIDKKYAGSEESFARSLKMVEDERDLLQKELGELEIMAKDLG